MAFGNITSANASAVLVVDTLFPAGIQLQNYSSDQSISQDEVTFTETRMGVDGKMVAGYTPSIKAVTLNFEAVSPSVSSINAVALAMEQNLTVYECTLIVTIPSLSRTYTYTGGVLKSGKTFPDNKKVLEPMTYKFEFESMKSTEI